MMSSKDLLYIFIGILVVTVLIRFSLAIPRVGLPLLFVFAAGLLYYFKSKKEVSEELDDSLDFEEEETV